MGLVSDHFHQRGFHLHIHLQASKWTNEDVLKFNETRTGKICPPLRRALL